MGRSGSSAVTRVLSLCGAVLPAEILQPNFGNPTGYWEPARAVEINDRFLYANASSWYDTALRLQDRSLETEDTAALIEQAAGFLAGSAANPAPLVIKDPRISGLLPHWIAAAGEARLQPTFVHIFRNPDDVAASLTRRDNLPADRSRALWLKYNLVPERDTRGFARIFVSYEDLMEDWNGAIDRVAAELAVQLTVSGETETTVAAFLSPDLRHHATPDGDPIADDDTRLVSRAYRLLNDAKRGQVATDSFDELLIEYGRSAFATDPPDLTDPHGGNLIDVTAAGN